MKTFDELWRWVNSRGSVITVQDRMELEHVFNLMKDCNSYLEVGTAEGNSLYVLGHAVNGPISYVDLGELHTREAREEVEEALKKEGKTLSFFKGDSTIPKTHPRSTSYDCVLIDGGHDFATVLSDAILYAPLARKYVFFHDIQLPEVARAVEWFVKRWRLGNYGQFVNSEHFGYGIIEITDER